MKHLIVDFLNRWKWWILLLLVFGGFVNLHDLSSEAEKESCEHPIVCSTIKQ
jgi:hypothetical protein